MNRYIVIIENCNKFKLLDYGTIEYEFKLIDNMVVFDSEYPIDALNKLDFIINIEPDEVGYLV